MRLIWVLLLGIGLGLLLVGWTLAGAVIVLIGFFTMLYDLRVGR